jgi:UDP-3-O-[3-hydroxymyristoyl] glucosamine N-acyltransferase
VGVGEGVSLGGMEVPVGVGVAVGTNVEVGEAVSVGTGVTVAKTMVIGGKGGVLVTVFGTHNLCPENMVVE